MFEWCNIDIFLMMCYELMFKKDIGCLFCDVVEFECVFWYYVVFVFLKCFQGVFDWEKGWGGSWIYELFEIVLGGFFKFCIVFLVELWLIFVFVDCVDCMEWCLQLLVKLVNEYQWEYEFVFKLEWEFIFVMVVYVKKLV